MISKELLKKIGFEWVANSDARVSRYELDLDCMDEKHLYYYPDREDFIYSAEVLPDIRMNILNDIQLEMYIKTMIEFSSICGEMLPWE
jgi:hypothetical protein